METSIRSKFPFQFLISFFCLLVIFNKPIVGMLSFIEYRFKRQGNRTAIFKSAKTYAAPASLNNRPVVLFPPEIYQVEPYFKSLITVGLTDDFCAWRVTLRYSFSTAEKENQPKPSSRSESHKTSSTPLCLKAMFPCNRHTLSAGFPTFLIAHSLHCFHREKA